MRNKIIKIGRSFRKLNTLDELYSSLIDISDELSILFNNEQVLIEQKELKSITEKFTRIENDDDIELLSLKISEISTAQFQQFCSDHSINHCFVMFVDEQRQIFVGVTEKTYQEIKQSHRFELFLHKLKSTYQRISMMKELKKRLKENQLLFDIGRKITSSLNLNDVLNSILDGLKQLIDYDAAGIFLKKNSAKYIEQVIHRGYDESRLNQFKEKSSHGLSAWVLEHKIPAVVPDVSIDDRYFNARDESKSQVTVPMFNGYEIIGTFTLEKDDLNFYNEEIVPLLQTMAEQAAIAIINARLYADSLQKKKLEEDLINAASIQSTLLAKRAPKINGLDLSLYSKASQYLGGDIHDFIKLSDSSLIFSIGDVSGKGAPASILMAVLFAGLRSQISRNYQICEHVAHLNNLLSQSTNTFSYATYFLAHYNNEKQELVYSNAGHTPPILIRKNGDILRLEKGGMVIGFLENEAFVQERIHIEKGDVFLAFTDGLDEAFNTKDEEFGVERIIDILRSKRHLSSSEIKCHLVDEVVLHHGEKLDDDVTIIVGKF